jgi:hypothetical protein
MSHVIVRPVRLAELPPRRPVRGLAPIRWHARASAEVGRALRADGHAELADRAVRRAAFFRRRAGRITRQSLRAGRPR